jgi:hypothetical protein
MENDTSAGAPVAETPSPTKKAKPTKQPKAKRGTPEEAREARVRAPR